MTPEQELFWRQLKLDPKIYCYDAGEQMALVKRDPKHLHYLLDKHIFFVMENFTDEWILRIVKTWLNRFQLPIDASMLKSMNNFHARFSHQIRERTDNTSSNPIELIWEP